MADHVGEAGDDILTYAELEHKIRLYEQMPQSCEREYALVDLRWRLERLDIRQRLRVLDLATLLFKAFLHHGQASVMLQSGQVLTETVPSGDGVRRIWNMESKAESMAIKSVIPYEGGHDDGHE